MASGGQSGFGTTLSGSTTGVIVEITSISHPSIESGDIDITTMSSTNGWREFTPALKDAGELTVEIFYTVAQTNTIEALIGGTAETWTVTFPDGGAWACSGYVKSLGGATPMDDGITQSMTIKLSGQPTFT